MSSKADRLYWRHLHQLNKVKRNVARRKYYQDHIEQERAKDRERNERIK